MIKKCRYPYTFIFVVFILLILSYIIIIIFKKNFRTKLTKSYKNYENKAF